MIAPSLFRAYNKSLKITYNGSKDAANLAQHAVSLALVVEMEWDSAVIWPDLRRDYGEQRMVGIGYIGLRLYHVTFVDRPMTRRIISLRKANLREIRRYAET